MGCLGKTSNQKNSNSLKILTIPRAMTKELKVSGLLKISPRTHIEPSVNEQHLVSTYENASFFFFPICSLHTKIVISCRGTNHMASRARLHMQTASMAGIWGKPIEHNKAQPLCPVALVIIRSLFKQTQNSNLVNRVPDRINSKIEFCQLVYSS